MKKFKRTVSALLSLTMVTSAAFTGGIAVSAVDNATASVKLDTSKIKEKINQKLKNDQEKQYVEGEAVVMLNSDVVASGSNLEDELDISCASGDIKVEDVQQFADRKNSVSVATVSSDELTTEELVKNLNDNDDVLIAEPNYTYHTLSLTNDAYSDFQWSLDNQEKNQGKKDFDINPEKLWDEQTPTDVETPVVAVLDTGVDFTHEDLENKMWVNPYQKKLPGKYGINIIAQNNDIEPMDDNGHGTHCAGIIAAEQNNGKGIAGVSQNAKIMAIKWIDKDGSGELENAVIAYNYLYRAIKLGVNVVAINNSWGGNADSEILTTLMDKVGKLGAVSVCAAGNESVDLDKDYDFSADAALRDKNGGSLPEDDFNNSFKNSKNNTSINATKGNPDDLKKNQYIYPACSNSEYIVTVAAANEYGEVASYSNYGDSSVDVAAPGSDILSSVHYNCFNPAIYSDNDEKCLLYKTNDFNAKIVSNQNKGETELKTVADSGFTDAEGDNNSLQWKITGAKAGETYQIEIPYTADTEQNPYLSAMVRVDEIRKDSETSEYDIYGFPSMLFMFDVDKNKQIVTASSEDSSCIGFNYLVSDGEDWEHLFGQSVNVSSKERKIVFLICIIYDGDYSVSIDDIGVSKGIKGEEKTFGKYDFFSGTSMATPAVTGSIALLKEKSPTYDAKQLITAIKNRTKQDSSFDRKVNKSLVLDLGATNDVSSIPDITSTAVNNKALEINGTSLAGCSIDVNGKTVSPQSTADKKITVTDSSVFNKNVELKVYNEKGYNLTSGIYSTATKYTEGSSQTQYFSNYNIVTDGKYIYKVDELGNLDKYSVDTKTAAVELQETFVTDLDIKFSNKTNDAWNNIKVSGAVYYNGYVYYVANCNMTLANNSDVVYDTTSTIVKVNTSTGKTTFIDYDYEKINQPTVAVLNNTLYIIGGFDGETNTPLTTVYKYASNKWQSAASLPSARALGRCLQIDNSRLVYTLGTDGTENFPQNLFFNGSTWTESKAEKLKTEKTQLVKVGDKEYTSYQCGVGLVSGGLLYTDVLFDGMGDTVKYTTSTDKFTTYSKYFYTSKNNFIRGIIVNNTYIGIATDAVLTEQSDDDWGSYDNTSESNSLVTVSGLFSYKFGVTSGMYQVKASSAHGKVSGTGVFYPGETAKITVTPNKNFKLASITINGKTYKTSTVSFKVTTNTTVSVKYTELVSSVKLSNSKKTLKVGKTFKLTAKISSSTAANKNLSWSTSKKTVAKIKKNSNTKVTVTAVRKGSAVITAKAKDGSKKYAKCKITVKKK